MCLVFIFMVLIIHIKASSQNAAVFSESLTSYRRKITVTVRVYCDFYCDFFKETGTISSILRQSLYHLLVIKFQNAHEGFLRYFDGSYLSHTLLTFLLLFEEFLLT